RNLRHDLEKCALARAIPTDDSENLPFLDLEAHVVEGPEPIPETERLALVADRQERIGLSAKPGPPTREGLPQHSTPDHTQAVFLAQMLDQDLRRHAPDPIPCP